MDEQKNQIKESIDVDFVIHIPGHDRLRLQKQNGHFVFSELKICSGLYQAILSYKTKYGNQIELWPEPQETSHEFLLIKEIIQRVKGAFLPPSEHQILCHCRKISSQVVDQAILMGAHTSAEVSRITSAGTACGTCQSDIEKWLAFRLS